VAEPIKELWVAEWSDGVYRALRDRRPGFEGNADTFRRFVPEPEWKLFDPSNPPPDGDYCCEVPALVCSDGTIPVRLLHWYDGVWGGAYGAYEVRRYTPAPVAPELVP
jgi:hypothetical protein